MISMAPIELLPSLAQSGSVSGLGPEGRRFKSYMTDQIPVPGPSWASMTGSLSQKTGSTPVQEHQILDLMGNVVSLSGL